jgi:putative transposase
VRRSYKFQLRPTYGQAMSLAAMLEDHRQLYNAALEHRKTAYEKSGVSIGYGVQSADLKYIRRDDPDGQGRWSFCSQQATLRRLDRAFAGFFRRLMAGEKPGYPRFKGRGRFNTVEWPEDGDGCRWNSVPGQTRLRLQAVGHIKVNQHRAVAGDVKTVSVKREGHRWYVVLSCDNVPGRPLPQTGAVTGIDMGVVWFLTTSEGVHIENPRYFTTSTARLAGAQRQLARAKRGSNRRHKARIRAGAVHRKIRNQRLDFAHKTAVLLVRDHDVICHEALKVASMTRSASGTTAAPGRNVAQKTGLNQAILDAGWGVFLSILRAKAESAGRAIVEVNPRHTSQQCTRCGHTAAGNRLSQSAFRCLACGLEMHADTNAAKNILRAGLALRAIAA